MSEPAFVAVDWGTTRLRATLIGRSGDILGRAVSENGVQSVAAGGFGAALDEACRPWFVADASLPVLMAGMVGSRNGWTEVPYVSPPCGARELGLDLRRITDSRRPIFIVPGVDDRTPSGSYDVMRGEETQAVGSGVRDGLVCLPGTHSKWVEMVAGRIARFVTFATGELYAALTQSFVGRLAEAPSDTDAGEALAAKVSQWPGGVTRQVFQARAQVLGGLAPGHAVRPFLSSLLIRAEISGARDVFGSERPVALVAGEPQLNPYTRLLGDHGFDVTVVAPEAATLDGLRAVAETSRAFLDMQRS